MQQKVSATFKVDVWDTAEEKKAGEGLDLATVRLEKTYTEGDLVGTATGFMLTSQGEAAASYVCQERVTGTLGDRSGTFVLEHGALKVGEDEAETWARIVTGSGTGGLSGITGGGKLGHGTLDIQVELPG